MSKEVLVLKTIEEVSSYQDRSPRGLVPTMGYLHEGHLSLMRRAREECASVIVSIFVNPLQFGEGEDLGRYPRDLERDLDLAAQTGVDAVFAPSTGELYPEGFATAVKVRGIEDILEGAARPGHFTGVATVVSKLLNIVQPDLLYMGQKDAQQAVLVRRMIEDLNFPVRLVLSPTIRERDGLALSSRNVYLNPEERAAAAVISRALFAARDSGELGPEALERMVRDRINSEPLARLEYVSANDAQTLGSVTDKTRSILVSCAVHFGGTRLIDNVVIDRIAASGE